MANIFTLENVTDFSEKLNIDELYEKKRQYDLNKLTLFNKILNRIHFFVKNYDAVLNGLKITIEANNTSFYEIK